MTWKPILTFEDATTAHSRYETDTLDFKMTSKDTEPAELAKDVAAFANHVGGTILVGMKENKPGLAPTPFPMSGEELAKQRRRYEKAVQSFCDPLPSFMPHEIEREKGALFLAVNVYPFSGIVGVRAASGSEQWTFPIRVATQTKFLSPTQVTMYTPTVRSAIVSLSRLKAGQVIQRINEPNYNAGNNPRQLVQFQRINLDENNFEVLTLPGNTLVHYPLDMVRSVYKGDSGWEIFLNAFR